MRRDLARDDTLDAQILACSSQQRLELWVQGSGFLDDFHVLMGSTLMAGCRDNRTHVFPIERGPGLMAVLVRFQGRRGGHSAIVDVTSEATKLQERDDHCYVLRTL